MVAALLIQPFESLPGDIAVLVEAGRSEGHDLVKRLVDDWQDGSNRFSLPGEVALAARIGTRLVGVGGLNRDPYVDDPNVGRIRHVYVAADMRGAGVGRAQVTVLVDHAREQFARVRLRTVTPYGAAFYSALGFDEISEEKDATHQIWLS